MPKMRQLNTRFWYDGYVVKLTPLQKLLFLYLLTNSKTETCGCYEIPTELIAFETGINSEMVEKLLSKFEKDGKIIRHENWILLVNFLKHQTLNPNMLIGVSRSIEEIPLELAKILKASEWFPKGSEPLPSHSLLKLKLKLKPELKLKGELEGDAPSEPPELTPKEIAQKFFEDTEHQKKILDWLVSKGIEEPIAKKELDSFISYWTEKNSTGKKQRWELERTFEIERRLRTWMDRASKNNGSNAKRQWHLVQ